MPNVEILAESRRALVGQPILEVHRTADPNVLSAPNVAAIRLVFERNAGIHVLVHVVSVPLAPLLITLLFVVVKRDTLVIHL